MNNKILKCGIWDHYLEYFGTVCINWTQKLFYTPGSRHTFILAHIDITINLYLLRFVHANHLQNGPRQANLLLIAYASSEGSGEPAHPRSLARTSAARSYKPRVKRNLQTESQITGLSEWLGIRS